MAALLTGCVVQETGPYIEGTPRFDDDGLQPAGSVLRVDFGRAQTGAVETMRSLMGRPPESILLNRECGAGEVTIVRWPGVTLNFVDGDFRGWVLDAPGYRAGPLEVGMERDSLPDVRLIETSLGREFAYQGVYGLIAPGDDRVAVLWSGVTCFFR